ncbi:MAG: hypothetical protein JW737_07920 [Acidobacteria bacterium]|nr:hypothetical protein [Acidobacteriota bacterium]
MRFRIILIISIIIIPLFIFVLTHKVGEDLIDYSVYKRLISENASTFFIINFQMIADSGFSFSAQEGFRGEYFKYLEDSIGFQLERDCSLCLVVEMLYDKTQFGIDGDLNNSKIDSYYFIISDLREETFIDHYKKRFNSEPNRILHRERYVYDIPPMKEGDDQFKVTFLPNNYIILSSNLKSLDTALNLYYGEVHSILNNPELDKIFSEIPKELPTWGYFKYDGRTFPPNIEEKIPGASGLRYVVMANSMDNRMNIMNSNFHLNNVDSLSTFTESINRFMERMKKEYPHRTDQELLSQVHIEKRFKSLNITFYFTHEQQLRIEKMIRLSLKDYLAQ